MERSQPMIGRRSGRKDIDGDHSILPGKAPLEEGDATVERFSMGIDNRVYLGSPTYNLWHTGLTRIGAISGALPDYHCSGFLVGTRVAITAAHCLFMNASAQPAIAHYFTPQQHGQTDSSTPASSMWRLWAPWGSSQVQSFDMISGWWLYNSCHVSGGVGSECSKYDFAALVLPSPPPWGGGTGYLGVVCGSDSWVGARTMHNAGYPTSPPSGDKGQPWGIWYNCGVAAPTFGDPSPTDNWPWVPGDNPHMHTGCDVTTGHSGSPILTYDLGSDAYALGVVRGFMTGTHGSLVIRFNSTMIDYMAYMRSIYQ